MTVVTNITIEHNKFAPSTNTDDLKVDDTFEQQVHTMICGSDDNDDRKEYLWRLMPQSQKSSSKYFKIGSFV